MKYRWVKQSESVGQTECNNLKVILKQLALLPSNMIKLMTIIVTSFELLKHCTNLVHRPKCSIG